MFFSIFISCSSTIPSIPTPGFSLILDAGRRGKSSNSAYKQNIKEFYSDKVLKKKTDFVKNIQRRESNFVEADGVNDSASKQADVGVTLF